MKTLTPLAVSLLLLSSASCKRDHGGTTPPGESVSSSSSGSPECERAREVSEKNKQIVMSFYQEFFGDHDFDAANKYIGDVYIQHNPAVADGRDALVEAGKAWLAGAPKKTLNFSLVVAEGDLVFVQLIDEANGTRTSTMDVFRVTDGKITEHWDAFATFHEGDESKNDHPLF